MRAIVAVFEGAIEAVVSEADSVKLGKSTPIPYVVGIVVQNIQLETV